MLGLHGRDQYVDDRRDNDSAGDNVLESCYSAEEMKRKWLDGKDFRSCMKKVQSKVKQSHWSFTAGGACEALGMIWRFGKMRDSAMCAMA